MQHLLSFCSPACMLSPLVSLPQTLAFGYISCLSFHTHLKSFEDISSGAEGAGGYGSSHSHSRAWKTKALVCEITYLGEMISSGCLRAFARPTEKWKAGEGNEKVLFTPRLLSTKGSIVILCCFPPNLPWQEQLLEKSDLYEGHGVYFNDLCMPELPGDL